mmetsp:Transcript_9764/g.26033  ORF Transcript_9764/g.26033 Transcript_9764/m.26033 type:complete len:772 (-) Transcript_9764:148-2463(-)
MELLERLVLSSSGTAFARNKNLQNLLILTAIKAESSGGDGARTGRVMEYLRRMDNYDALDIAKVCTGAGLHEEAYTIYHKFERQEEALEVLLEHLKDYKRAEEYASRLDQPAVWSKLGEALLRDAGRVADGVRALLRAKDARPYLLVVESAREHGSDSDYALVAKYLRIVRAGLRGERRVVDTELAYAFCRCDKLHELHELLVGRNDADLEDIAERVFDEERWEAAKLLMTLTSNWAQLTRVLCELKEFDAALDSARKADKIEIWQTLACRCVDASELRIAHKAALRVVVEPDLMQDMISYYEDRGLFDALLALVDAALLLEAAHQALFTAAGVLYTKYRETAVLEFCHMWWQRCNVPQLVRACELAYLWTEVVYLQRQYGELDNATRTMMAHPSAWLASTFIEVVAAVRSLDVLYLAVRFYAEQHTDMLADLLLVLAPTAEPSRIVSILRAAPVASAPGLFGPVLGLLPESRVYLHKVIDSLGAEKTPLEVAEALLDVYFAEEALLHLRELIDTLRDFDQLALSERLESHANAEFRQLAVELHKRGGRHERAIELAKKEKLWKDAIAVAAHSADAELCEQLAEWFLANGMRESLTAMLYACYPTLLPDVGVELAWVNNALPLAMPFMVQTLSEVGARLTRLHETRETKRESEKEQKAEEEKEVNEDESVLLYGLASHYNQPNRMLALPAAGGGALYGGGGGGGGTVGGSPMMIGWNNYRTYAQQMYQTRAAMSQQQMMMSQRNAQMYQTGLHAAYATRAAQEAYATMSNR